VLTAAPIVENAASPLAAEQLAERALGLPIDFDAYFSAGAVSAADLFLVDDSGQFEYYREAGYFRGWPAPDKSLGEALLTGTPPPPCVVCANLGIGALDAAFAGRVVEAARAEGVGTALPR
jgi:ornithine cyclodeaminase/alanine dehydrogenase